MEPVSFKRRPVLRRRRVSQSAVIRDSLESTLLEQPRARGERTCADLAGGLIGSFRGPRDGSTNKRYLEQAVLADAKRGKKRRR